MISQDEDTVSAKALPTVLFIDDDERLLESLRLALRREPYEILTVTSTERASRVLAQRKVDVVVCDERMPTMSGTTFLTHMKNAAHPAIRIVLTGAGRPAEDRAANQAAVFRFLTKPCSSSAIALAIREALQHIPL